MYLYVALLLDELSWGEMYFARCCRECHLNSPGNRGYASSCLPAEGEEWPESKVVSTSEWYKEVHRLQVPYVSFLVVLYFQTMWANVSSSLTSNLAYLQTARIS